MMIDEIIALLTDNRDGMKVSAIVNCLEPKACGTRKSELFFMVDRECSRLVIKGTCIREVRDDEPFYKMKVMI